MKLEKRKLPLLNEAIEKANNNLYKSSTYLEDIGILEDGYCICGTKLEDHPECIEELKKRLKGTSGVRNETFYKEYYNIKEVINRLKDLPKIDSHRRVLGVIRPTAECIGPLTHTRHIGILATTGTINSKSYEMEIKKLQKGHWQIPGINQLL